MRDSILGIRDKGGRRSGIDRRKFFIPEHAPENRSGQDRRSNQERRKGRDLSGVSYLKRGTDRYMEFANTQKGLFLAIMLSLPVWALIIFMIFNKVRL